MNKHIIKSLWAFAAAALTFAGCEVNDFNENYLDGFETNGTITDVQNLVLTLTDADYTAIAGNSTNKSLAQAAGGDAPAVLAAIGTNKYFASKTDAATYLPAFLTANYNTLDDNSTALITYTLAQDVPAELVAMNNLKSYTLTKADYQKVWGSETDYVEAITPATAGKLASAISAEGLEAGNYVAVTYNYAASEPSFGGESENPGAPEFTSVLGKAAKGDAVTVTGYIAALSSQGPILTDNGGSILLYGNNATSHLALGEVVTVTGTIASYNNGFQFDAAASTIEQYGETVDVIYPEPVEIDGAGLDELLTSRTDKDYYAQFVKVEGTVSISGTYYNFNVEGAETAQGSFYGPTDAIKAKVENGKKATLYGYLSSVSKSGGAPKFVNIIVTHVNEEPVTGPALTSVIGTVKKDDAVTVTGYISAVSKQGPILTDNSGSLLLYGYSQTSDLVVGDVVSVSGTIASYNKGLQIAASSATIEKVGTTSVTYPEATELTGAAMDALLTSRTNDECAQYVKLTGTVAINGNNVNILVDGAETAQGSIYGITDEMKASLGEGGQTVTLHGYFIAIAGSRYLNIVATKVENAASAAAYLLTRAGIATEQKYAVYAYDGSKFTDSGNAVVQPSDYRAMGQNYDNLTDPDQNIYLPQFLGANYPYGKSGDTKYVSYICRKDGANNWTTDEYMFNGSAWEHNAYFEAREDQFRVSNKSWKYDPTLELDFSAMGSAEFKAFLQYCANWVYDNVDVARYGAPARDNAGNILSTESIKVNGSSPAGSYFVSSYGNNEWYAGTYAYYGEMNWRADQARASWENAGFTGMTDAEIVAGMQKNAAEVFAGVLHAMYPDVTTENYSKAVIKVYNYFEKEADGARKGVYSYTFTVAGQGEFEYVEDSFTFLE